MAADVRDAAQVRRAVRQQAQRRDGRRELADVVQVVVDAVQGPGASHDESLLRRARPIRPSRSRSRATRLRPGWSGPASRERSRCRRWRARRRRRAPRWTGPAPPVRRRAAPATGGTTHRSGVESSTSTPCRRSCSIVIATCGSDGRDVPTWRRSTPSSYLGAASSNAEMNWLDAEASICTSPPRTRPWPMTVNGIAPRPSSSISTPRPRSACSTSCIGRSRACGSPSKTTGPSASAASGGTKRMTVPASPQSMVSGPRNGPGVIFQSSPLSSTEAPRSVSARAISWVSRETRALRTTLGPSASAPSTSARLVWDLEPGSRTTASTGPSGWGAGHSW